MPVRLDDMTDMRSLDSGYALGLDAHKHEQRAEIACEFERASGVRGGPCSSIVGEAIQVHVGLQRCKRERVKASVRTPCAASWLMRVHQCSTLTLSR